MCQIYSGGERAGVGKDIWQRQHRSRVIQKDIKGGPSKPNMLEQHC